MEQLAGKTESKEIPPWMQAALSEAIKEARRLKAARPVAVASVSDYGQYEADPVGFGEKVLGDTYTEDIKRVMRSVLDNPVTIAKSATDVGKSHGAARVALWFYMTYKDSKVFLAAAPPIDNLRRVLFGEILAITEKRPELFVGHRIKSMGIYRGADSFIQCVAIPQTGAVEAKFSGKHAPHLLFIVDEGDAVPEEVYRGIEGCMSGGEIARLLVMFNPRTPQGILYDMEKERRANVVEVSALTHPNIVAGRNIIRGAVTRETVVRRINEWTKPLREEEVVEDAFEVPEFLVGTVSIGLDGRPFLPLTAGRRKVEDASFWYMVLGKYPPQGEHQLISMDWIDAARKRWDEWHAQHGDRPPDGVRPIMGLDVAELGGDWNIACMRYGGYVGKFLAWQGLDAAQTADKSLQLYTQYHVDIAMIDGMGIGSSIAPTMARRGREQDVRAVGVKVSERPLNFIKAEQGEFRMIRDQLWWAVREWLRTDETAMLPPDRMLIEELLVPSYRVPGGKIKVTDKESMRDKLRRSPDRADALCLTFYPVRRAKVIKLRYGYAE